VVERGSGDGVDFDDRLWGAAVAACAAGGGERVVEGVDVISAQPAERDVTDGGVG
jgi:hypothetical protein